MDIAAPGVAIKSSAPGGRYVSMSGTSQAAPYVSNIATSIMEINPLLTPSDVKKILMKTVDKKSFLRGKVKSGGIVNKERALYAAQESRFNSVDFSVIMGPSTMWQIHWIEMQ